MVAKLELEDPNVRPFERSDRLSADGLQVKEVQDDPES